MLINFIFAVYYVPRKGNYHEKFNHQPSHTILPSPIKEIDVEHERSDLYKGFLVLEDGTKIQSNYGCIGMRCFGASGKDRQEVMDGWKKELEKFWFSRKLAVLVA